MSQVYQFAPLTTTQKNAITTPQTGQMVYDSTLNKLCVYNGTGWNTLPNLTSGVATAVSSFTVAVDLTNVTFIKVRFRITQTNNTVSILLKANAGTAFSEFQRTVTLNDGSTLTGTDSVISLTADTDANGMMSSGIITICKQLGSSLRIGMAGDCVFGHFDATGAINKNARCTFSGFTTSPLTALQFSVSAGTITAQYSLTNF